MVCFFLEFDEEEDRDKDDDDDDDEFLVFWLPKRDESIEVTRPFEVSCLGLFDCFGEEAPWIARKRGFVAILEDDFFWEFELEFEFKEVEDFDEFDGFSIRAKRDFGSRDNLEDDEEVEADVVDDDVPPLFLLLDYKNQKKKYING